MEVVEKKDKEVILNYRTFLRKLRSFYKNNTKLTYVKEHIHKLYNYKDNNRRVLLDLFHIVDEYTYKDLYNIWSNDENTINPFTCFIMEEEDSLASLLPYITSENYNMEVFKTSLNNVLDSYNDVYKIEKDTNSRIIIKYILQSIVYLRCNLNRYNSIDNFKVYEFYIEVINKIDSIIEKNVSEYNIFKEYIRS